MARSSDTSFLSKWSTPSWVLLGVGIGLFALNLLLFGVPVISAAIATITLLSPMVLGVMALVIGGVAAMLIAAGLIIKIMSALANHEFAPVVNDLQTYTGELDDYLRLEKEGREKVYQALATVIDDNDTAVKLAHDTYTRTQQLLEEHEISKCTVVELPRTEGLIDQNFSQLISLLDDGIGHYATFVLPETYKEGASNDEITQFLKQSRAVLEGRRKYHTDFMAMAAPIIEQQYDNLSQVQQSFERFRETYLTPQAK